jgi:4'-phosphopantetheinyl transferase
MPLVLHQNIENGEFGLWKISEEIEELLLLAQLSDLDRLNYSEISATHRKKEWLTTRVLLNALLNKPASIKYHNDGRPFPANGQFNISISHTKGFVAILIHRLYSPGIDIELISRQVGKVATRFLSPDELVNCRETTDQSNQLLLIHWCAKEAIFKMVPFTNIEFSTDIQILLQDMSKDTGSFDGWFNTPDGPIHIPLDYLVYDEVVMVWGYVDELKLSR